MDQERIGKFIAECRKERKLTQLQLAEKLGVTDRSVSKWENGRCMPDLSLMKPLCNELGITINGEKVMLVKPQTFMNLSGEAVRGLVDFYKEDIENVLIIFDDIDLEVGKIRIKERGSAGTHNGMKSVISELHTQEFARIRIGIGVPKKQIDLANYVLEKVQKKDFEVLESASINACKAIEDIIKIINE